MNFKVETYFKKVNVIVILHYIGIVILDYSKMDLVNVDVIDYKVEKIEVINLKVIHIII